jgi:hypothetical protein
MAGYNSYDTTAIAVQSIKQGFDNIVMNVQDKINIVVGDLVEPMELYMKHY